jgi:histidine triad (HIT) family protein
MKLVQEVAQTISDSKLKPWGFNYLSNEGSIAGQEVMHFHVHIIPKYAKHAGLKLSLGSQNLNTIDNVYNDIKNVKKKGSF